MQSLIGFLKRLFLTDSRSRGQKVEKSYDEQIQDELNRPVNRGG